MVTVVECIRLAELTCARLCHDLSGLIGTVAGTVEMAMADQRAPDDALSLAADASRDLTLRLKLFRAAWGLPIEPVSVAELRNLARGLPPRPPITVDMTRLSDQLELPPLIGRSLLNFLLLGAEALPGGGDIALMGTAHGVFIRLTGPRAAWPPDLALCLADPDAAVAALESARGLQMPLSSLFVHAAGLRASMLIPVGPTEQPPPIFLAWP